jgi:hypothetical protein
MQYTIRKIPRKLDQALRRKARQEGKSLNAIAIDVLSRGVGINASVIANHDLDFAIGTWVQDAEFDKAIADQRRIDADL